MRDACGESSESLDSPRFLCSECQEIRRMCSDAQVLFQCEAWPSAGNSFRGNEGFPSFCVLLFLCTVQKVERRRVPPFLKGVF